MLNMAELSAGAGSELHLCLVNVIRSVSAPQVSLQRDGRKAANPTMSEHVVSIQSCLYTSFRAIMDLGR